MIKYSKINYILIFLIFIGGFLLFWNLGNYYLWGDEGVTAFYGKAITKLGWPLGFDGRNLHQTKNGLYLNFNLLPHLDAWLQYYTASASMIIFGKNSFGARAIFAIIGLATVIMQYQFVSKFFQNNRLALINCVFIVFSVSFILFSRQCRYYTLVMFFTSAIAWLYTISEKKIIYFIVSFLFFLLFFISHYIIAFAILSAMAISFFLFNDRRKSLRFFLMPLPALCIIIIPFLWLLSRDGALKHPNVLKNINPSDFFSVFYLYIKDYNITQLMPFGMLLILLIIWLKKAHCGSFNFKDVNRECAIFLFIIIFTLLLSILSPQMSDANYSDIRYACAIFPMLLLTQAFVVEKIFCWRKWAGFALILIAILTNLLTFMPFKSYFGNFLKENIEPFDNSVKTAVIFLDSKAKQNDIVLVSPNHMVGSMEFYLGEKLLFCNILSEDSLFLAKLKIKLPYYIYSNSVIPDWIVLFGLTTDLPHTQKFVGQIKNSKYVVHQLHVFGPDVSRPEIFWRSFEPITNYRREQGLIILERIK
jgi:4-amino-4-deoxy-L-arabinose transferase-like glycosyltransferase